MVGQLGLSYFRVGNSLVRRGRTDRPLASTVAFDYRDETTFAPNMGPQGTLVPWSLSLLNPGDTTDNTNLILYLDRDYSSYHHIDFGPWMIKPRCIGSSLADVKGLNTRNGTAQRNFIDCRDANNVNTKIKRIDSRNAAKYSPGFANVYGHNFEISRSYLAGGSDIIDPNARVNATNINVQILENLFGGMSWWAAKTTGIVHPSDDTSHNDDVQIGIGDNLEIARNCIDAQIDLVLGTGAPETGSEFGTGADYTQAEGEAMRDGSYGAQYGILNSSLAALMYATAGSSRITATKILDNILGGGSYTFNGGQLTNRVAGEDDGSIVQRNQFKRNTRLANGNMRLRAATLIDVGNGPTLGTGSGGPSSVGASNPDRNRYYDTGTPYAERPETLRTNG